MSRRNLRTALAGLTLAAALTAAPPPAAAEDGAGPTSSLAGKVWQWVVGVWMGSGEQADIGWQIDPDGLNAPPEETGGGGPMSEISLQIDPNG